MGLNKMIKVVPWSCAGILAEKELGKQGKKADKIPLVLVLTEEWVL